MTEEVDGGLPAFADSEGTGVAHRVIGDTLPVLEVQLKSGQSVISQGGELSWMSPSVVMTTQTAGAGGSGFVGVLKRAVAGGTIFMSQYTASVRQLDGGVRHEAARVVSCRSTSTPRTSTWSRVTATSRAPTA